MKGERGLGFCPRLFDVSFVPDRGLFLFKGPRIENNFLFLEGLVLGVKPWARRLVLEITDKAAR
jgi:hypothetical protein